MPSIGGTIAAGGSLLGAGISSSAASSAAAQQAQAAQQATALQQQIYNTNTANLAPFKNVGQSANYSLANLYGLDPAGGTSGAGVVGSGTTGGGSIASGALSQLMALSGLGTNGQPSSTAIPSALTQFMNSPTYQFAAQQGQQALDRSAAANGMLLSGGQLKASQQYGQGLASQTLGSYTQNLQNLYSGLVSGLGGLANQGQNSAATTGQIGQSLTNAGTATASGILGSATATNNGISNSLAALTGNQSSYGSNSTLGSISSGLSSLFSSSPASTQAPVATTSGLAALTPGDFNLSTS